MILGKVVVVFFLWVTLSFSYDPNSFVPYEKFLKITKETSHAPFARLHSVRIHPRLTESSFYEIKEHVLDMYDGAVVKKSFVFEDFHYDCVTIESQPSARHFGLTKEEILSHQFELPIEDPVPFNANATLEQSEDELEGSFGDDSEECIEGTIPMQRLTLESLTQFSSLDHFLAKNPLAYEHPNATKKRSTGKHMHAHAKKFVSNHGGNSAINLWNRPVSKTQFTLSQQWFTSAARLPLQTIEGGYTHYLVFGAKPTLFIYSTTSNYKTGTGCYNIKCKGFVQTNTKVKLGGQLSSASTLGGTQYVSRYQWKFSSSKWFFFFNGKQVGYYPKAWWRGGPLTSYASTADFGGEVWSTTSKYPNMGSGQWPSGGYKKAAFQRNIFYISRTTNKGIYPALSRYQSYPKCFKVSSVFSNNKTDWRRYFYYGGPGGIGCV